MKAECRKNSNFYHKKYFFILIEFIRLSRDIGLRDNFFGLMSIPLYQEVAELLKRMYFSGRPGFRGFELLDMKDKLPIRVGDVKRGRLYLEEVMEKRQKNTGCHKPNSEMRRY